MSVAVIAVILVTMITWMLVTNDRVDIGDHDRVDAAQLGNHG
jgi:hypothetical protein